MAALSAFLVSLTTQSILCSKSELTIHTHKHMHTCKTLIRVSF